jgi:hypothetical protein
MPIDRFLVPQYEGGWHMLIRPKKHRPMHLDSRKQQIFSNLYGTNLAISSPS